jgi:hypothetical protein
MRSITLLLLLAGTLACAQAVEVRVKNTPGGPQIHVDGEPVPPRVFYGSGDRPGVIGIGPEWTTHVFEFTPEYLVNGQATFHFRFTPNTPGQYWIKELRLTDTSNGTDLPLTGSFASREAFKETWAVFPPDTANANGRTDIENDALHVTVSSPAQGKWPDFHLYSRMQRLQTGRSYRCSFTAKGDSQLRLVPAVYTVANGFHTLVGGPRDTTFLDQIVLARDAGVRFITFPASACWMPPEQPQDWTPLDTACRKIIAVHPDVLLVPRIGADAPRWWRERHPEALMVYDDGSATGSVACVSDRTYRAEVSAHLEKLTRHLCETFPNHFAGVHPCGQNTGEWFYQNSWGKPLSGYDPATCAAFRDWLKRRGTPDAETAEVPPATARRARPDGFLHNPSRDRCLIDFRLFLQDEMAEHILSLARACRRGSSGKKLVVFFYGYGFEFAPMATGASTSGHYGVGKLLRDGTAEIDILCGPCSYSDRSWIGTGPVMSAAESIKRAGILWLNEDDTRTHLFHKAPRPQYGHGATDTLRQTQHVLLRNTAQAALRGNGCWWMDLFGDGWYNDPAIWQPMVQLRAVDAAMVRRARPFTPEIAAIIGEASMCHLTEGAALAAAPLISKSRADFGRSGAPYGQYLLSDVLENRAAPRVQFFLSAWMLTPEQRTVLAAQKRTGFWRSLAETLGVLTSPHTTRVWCWAPGYLYPDRADAAGIQEVTGFKAKAVDLPTAEATPTGLGQSLGLRETWGPKAKIVPLFSVEAEPDEIWAVWSDGSPAVAMRRSKRTTDVFLGVPQLTPELIHAIARMGGAHCFAAPGPALWAAEGYLSVQAHTNGPVVLDTGGRQSVRDALNGSPLGEGPRVELDMKHGDVRVLEIGKRETHEKDTSRQ